MAQTSACPPPGKRSFTHEEPLVSDEAPSAKRACLESPPASAHLTLLEELCELDGDDAESCLRPLASEMTPQEDLVAEMMKSLEKVIEEGESVRGAGEASTSYPASDALSPLHDGAATLGLTWEEEASLNGDFQHQREEEATKDERIQHLLQVSDDELGIPLSSSSSDLDDSSFHEEWASLSDETGPAASFNLSWLEQFEESREIYEPVILF
ncbi:hypothetical protein L7F22_062804 [Adiantum nelumboides]|nr:hypothetical protein [Adiantum nelumboides]